MVDKRGGGGVLTEASSRISEHLSHGQPLSNIQHRPTNDTTVSVLYTS